MKHPLRISAALFILLFSGCQTITYDALLFDEVASLNRGALPPGYTVVGTFSYTTRASFTAFDLVTLHHPEFIAEMDKALKVNDGNAIINLSIVEETNIVDILINIFVNSLTSSALRSGIDVFSTRSVEIRGDVVKYTHSGEQTH
jgi:hypothetical protein